jgi:hypothetical protein
VGEELRDARDHVLVENTAQAVYKHLDRLMDRRAALGARWVWELLQNARDAAPKSGVKFELLLKDGCLVCRHNGDPFSPREIAHLIYHGSTKVDVDGAVGHFGSGFISTHLLSRTVKVRGRLGDGRCFAFLLDRTGATVDELRAAMDRSFDEFERSAGKTNEKVAHALTEYEYKIESDAASVVDAGISQFKSCAPLVLAFCPEVEAIAVTSSENRWSLKRGDATKPAPAVQVLAIECEQDGKISNQHVAFSNGKGEFTVALPIMEIVTGFTVAIDQSVPRLFIKFPLLGTERLAFPAAVNSTRFKPTEERDGVFLDGESESVVENRRILEQATETVAELLRYAAQADWEGMENALSFDLSRTPDWVDRKWL